MAELGRIAVACGQMNECPVLGDAEAKLSVRFWVIAAAKLPDGFRPTSGRSAQIFGFPKPDVR